MAITSAGYDETVTESSWAAMAGSFGSPYGVDGVGDLAVSGVAGVRLVSVAAGTAFGWGVRDVLDAAETVTLAANGGGSTRYDTIVLQRDWSTNTTSVVAVTGGSTPVLASLTLTPGTLTQQPLGIVPVSAGATSLDGVAVVDYRSRAPRIIVSAQAPISPVHHQLWMHPSGRMYVWNASTGIWSHGAPGAEAHTVDYTWTSNGWTIRMALVATRTDDGAAVASNAIVVPVAGLYQINYSQRFSAPNSSGTATLLTMVRRNSNGSPTGGDMVKVGRGRLDQWTTDTVLCERKLPLSAGDTIQAYAQSSLAGVTTAGATPTESALSVDFLRGL